MLGIETKFYKFPKPSTLSTMEQLADYFDEIKVLFVNKLGFYYKDRYTYNDVTYIDYYSDGENKDPIFCVYNSTGKKSMILISPCGTDGEDPVPLGGYTKMCSFGNNIYGAMGLYSGTPWCIVFNMTLTYNGILNCDLIVQDSKLADGRRAIFFKLYELNGGLPVQVSSIMGLFYTDVIYKDNLYLRDWFVMAGTFNSSYNSEIQDHLSSLNNLNKITNAGSSTQLPRLLGLNYITSLEEMGGLIPGLGQGKDYLIKQNLYVGEDAYIPSVYRYSNLIGAETGKGIAGNIVTIKNIDYLILYNLFRLYNNGNSGYTYDNMIDTSGYMYIENSYRNYNSKVINESLIIPI